MAYDVSEMLLEHGHLYACLTDEQRDVYHTIMDVVSAGSGGIFFLYGYGGTGKTSLWKTICPAIRGRGEIVLPVALHPYFSQVGGLPTRDLAYH